MSNNGYFRRFNNAPERPVPQYLHAGECSFVSLSQHAGIPAINYVRNPSFELGLDGWYAFEVTGTTTTWTRLESHDGSYSMRVNAPAGATYYSVGYMQNNAFPGPSPFPELISGADGGPIYAKAMVKACVGDKITIRFERDGIFAPTVPNHIPNSRKVYDGTGDWMLIEVDVDTTGSNPYGIIISSDNGSGCGQFHVDSAIISTGDVLFFDGDSYGAEWDGPIHASQSNIAAEFSLTSPVNLADLGLDVIAYEGFGVPPVENITTSFATQHGAHFQRQKFLPRTMTITFDVQTCDQWSDVARARCKFVKKIFGYKFRETCRFDMMLYWRLVDDCCGVMSNTLQIPVVYEGGLEGSQTFLWSERIILQLTAYEDPFFAATSQQSSLDFSIADPQRPDITGTEPVYPRIIITTGANAALIDRVINDTGGVSIAFRENNATGITIPANHMLIVDTDPLQFRIDLIPLSGGAGSAVDMRYTLDYANSHFGKFLLVPGENNVRIGTASTFPAGTRAIMTWRNKFVDSACAKIIRC